MFCVFFLTFCLLNSSEGIKEPGRTAMRRKGERGDGIFFQRRRNGCIQVFKSRRALRKKKGKTFQSNFQLPPYKSVSALLKNYLKLKWLKDKNRRNECNTPSALIERFWLLIVCVCYEFWLLLWTFFDFLFLLFFFARTEKEQFAFSKGRIENGLLGSS